MSVWLAIALSTFLGGCSTVSYQRPKFTQSSVRNKIKPLTQADREKLVQAAKSLVGRSELSAGKTKFRADCSGTVRAIFAKAGLKLGGILKADADNDVKLIYRFIKKYGQIVQTSPLAGDLVFFHNTYDRSRNGRMNDALTHVGIVEKVDGSTVSFIHHLGRSVIRSRMDLSKPLIYHDPKSQARLNHMLRKAQNGYPAFTAAQLFAGFGRL